MDLTDEQWAAVEPLLPKPEVRSDGRGRPWRDPRDVLNGILWILRTGAPWRDLPPRYPPRSTCHRRFQRWCRDGTLAQIRRALLDDLEKRGKLDLEESFVDGSFASAKKGGPLLVRPNAAKVRSGWQWSTVMVFQSVLPSTAPRPRRSPWSKKSSARSPADDPDG